MTITPGKAAPLLDCFENLANSGSGSVQHRGKITAGEIVVPICNVCNRWTTHTVRAEPGLYNHAACRRCRSRSHDRTRKDEPAYYRGTLP